jgi:hypothetical protein
LTRLEEERQRKVAEDLAQKQEARAERQDARDEARFQSDKEFKEEEIDLRKRELTDRERKTGITEKQVNNDYAVAMAKHNAEMKELLGVDYEGVRSTVDDLNKATKLYQGGGYLDPTSGGKALFNKIKVIFEDIEKDPNAVTTSGAFQIYQRFFDPATVRSEDARAMQDAEGIYDNLAAKYERLTDKGGMFAQQTVKDMYDIITKVHAMQQLSAKESIDAYIGSGDSATGLVDPRYRNRIRGYYDSQIGDISFTTDDRNQFIKDFSKENITLD